MQTVSLKTYTVVLGIYDEITTEVVVLREIGIKGTTVYEAHKLALLKCNLRENQTVLRIFEATSRLQQFDFQKGFTL